MSACSTCGCAVSIGAETSRAAREAGRRLVIALKRSQPDERAYFDEVIRPLLGPTTEYVGEVSQEEKERLQARGLYHG